MGKFAEPAAEWEPVGAVPAGNVQGRNASGGGEPASNVEAMGAESES